MLLPLLVPLFIAAVHVHWSTPGWRSLDGGRGFRVLVAFDVIFVVIGWLTFGFCCARIGGLPVDGVRMNTVTSSFWSG